MAESFYEKRRRELGLSSTPDSTSKKTEPKKTSEPSFYESRRMDLGLIPDTRPKPPEPVAPEPPKFVPSPQAGTLLSQAQSRLAANTPTSLGPVQTSLPSPGTAGALLQNTQKRLAANAPATPPEPELPGRDIPIVGPVLRGLDKLADVTKPASDIAQQLYVPGAGLANIGSFAGAVESGLARLAPGLARGSGLGATVGRNAIKEAVTGAPIGAGQVLATNPNATGKQVLEGAGTGAGIGAAGGGVLSGLAKTLGPAVTRLLQRGRIPEQQAQEILALPLGREDAIRAARALQPGTEPIINPYTFALPEGRMPAQRPVAPQPTEPLGLPAPRLSEPTRAQITRPVNPYRDSFETFMRNVQNAEQSGQLRLTPGREDADLDSLWTQYAGRTAPSLDEMIDLAYRPQPSRVTPDLVSQARNYQASRQAAGVGLPVKTLSERMQPQGVLGNVDSPITVPKGVRQEGVIAQAAPITQRFSRVQPTAAKPNLTPTSTQGIKASDAEKMAADYLRTNPGATTSELQKLFGLGYTNIGHLQDAVNKGVPYKGFERYFEAGKKTTSPAAANQRLMDQTAAAEPEVIQASPEPRIRDRVYAKLDEMEQAARKRLDAKKGRLSANPLGEWFDHGVIMAAKTGKGTIKAANFTEELVKEFGESIRPHAAAILRQTREILRTQERLASKEGQAAAAFNAGDGDASTFMQKISNGPTKKKRSLSEITQAARTQFSDDFAALEGLEKNVRGRVSSAENSLYKSARNIRGLPAKALQIVQDRLTPIANDIDKAGYSMDDLGAYALAKHAEDVNAAGYKSGFTDKEIADVIRKYGTPEMEAIRKKLVKVNDDMLQQLSDSGVISKELTETLRDRWPNYMPLFRALEDESVGFEGGLSKALANVASPIKTLKGSSKKVINPLENMVKNIFQSTSAAERNKVATQLANLAKDDPNNNFIRKIEPKHYATIRTNGNYARYEISPDVYEKIPGMTKEEKHQLARGLSGNPESTFTRTATDTEDISRKNVVNVKENGENVKYEVQPEVYKAMLNMDQESSNMLIKALQAPASLLRSGATLTPEFSLRNPMRDIVQAFIVSESRFNPFVDFPAGLIQTIKKGDLYKQWVDNLGDFGNTVSMDRNAHKEALRKVLGDTKSKKFVNVVTGRSLLRLLRAITDTTESATKVGEFRAALRRGATPQEAAYRARDIMDFGRAGSSIRQTNKVIAFLNANIQGKSKLIRAAKADPVGVGVRAFTAVTLPTVAFFMMKKYLANDTQRQTIDESPDWLKDSFWLVPVPGTDVVARIPKPFDLAPLFANLPEKALQFVYDKDKSAFDGFARRSIASYALPTQITGLLPLVEGMANYSFFREGQIIPQREADLQHKDQYDPVRTTEIAKLLAAGADAATGGRGPFKNFGSPRIMDNTISGLTAGLGSYATSAVDSILQGKVPFTNFKVGPNLVNRPEAPAKRLEQQPLAKAFLVDPLQSTKSMDKLYTRKEELTHEKSSASLNDAKFDSAKSKELKGLEKTADKLSKINKKIRTIESDQSLTAKQKREQIEVLLKQRNDLVGSTK